MKSTLLKAI